MKDTFTAQAAQDVLNNRQAELNALLHEQAAIPDRIKASARDKDTKSIKQLRGRAQELPHLVALARVDLEKARMAYISADYAEHEVRRNALAIERGEADKAFREAQARLNNAVNNLSQEEHRYPVPLSKRFQEQESLIAELEAAVDDAAITAALSI